MSPVTAIAEFPDAELVPSVLASPNSSPLPHHLPSNPCRIANTSASSSFTISRYSSTLPGAA
jgi:hypothetical protein